MSDQAILAAALNIPDAAGRAVYLAAACDSDTDRLGRLELLLAASETTGTFHAGPSGEAETRAFAAAKGLPLGVATRSGGEEAEPADDLSFLSPPQRADSLGRIGHYEALDVLGRGGFGIVFRAFDELLHRVVAVKVLAPAIATTSPARKRFLREARSSAAVQHDNVVRVHAVSRDDEPLPYLVMEYIPGETLQQRLDRTGPLEVTEIVRLGRQIAEGLAAAHAKGLIHRDIKPSNILTDGGVPPQAKITDFGLARAADDASLTRSGTVAGTPLYMAPEQARGETLDVRADLFSLGSVLYAMCTGHPPFRAGSTLAVLKRVCDDTPRPIREVIPEIPEWLCRIVEKLHAKDPAERFQTAAEVADVLADCERQLQSHLELRDYSLIPEAVATPRRSRRRRRVLLALGLLAAAVGALWVAPAVRRYADNRGEVEFLPEPGLREEIAFQGDNMGTDWTAVPARPGIVLDPGRYTFRALAGNSKRALLHWEVTAHGLFSSTTVLDLQPSPVIDVGRGQRYTVRAVMHDQPSLPAPTPAPAVTPVDPELTAKLKGEWQVQRGELDGKPIPASLIKDIGFMFYERKFYWHHTADGQRFAVTGTFRVEGPSKQLLFFREGFTVPIRATYVLNANRLTLDFAIPRDGATPANPQPFVRCEYFTSSGNLKAIGLAMHVYADAHAGGVRVPSALPPAAITNAKVKDGPLLLSWRVALLPYMGEEELHRQFKLDEPWDSEHNKTLIPKMPKTFAVPGVATKEPGLTHYRVFTGPGTAFETQPDRRVGVPFRDFEDGLANTFLVVEATDPVVWTKPDELPFDPNRPFPRLGVGGRYAFVVMGDGSVRMVPPDAPAATLKGLVTRSGGEIVAPEFARYEPQTAAPLYLELVRPGSGAVAKPVPPAKN